MSVQAELASYVILPISVVSSLIAILTIIIAGYLLYHFIIPHKRIRILKLKDIDSASEVKKVESSRTSPEHQHHINYYIKLSSVVCVFGNVGCSFFNALYCIHLVIDPYQSTEKFYKNHYSHFLRILSTVCWYIGTIAIIWFFNGRLFYAFKGSFSNYPRKTFIATNVFVTVMGVISVIVAYFGVYFGNLVIAEIAFTSFRISYQIITLILLYMFSRRLLFLTLCQHSIQLIKVPKQIQIKASEQKSQSEIKITPQDSNMPTLYIHSYQSNDSVSNANVIAEEMQSRHSQRRTSSAFEDANLSVSFLKLTAKNAVLVLVTSASVLLVTFCWFAFRFIFLPQTRLTLLIPMNMASIDSLVGSVSTIMLFHFGECINEKLCNRCNQCFINICIRCAKRKARNEIN